MFGGEWLEVESKGIHTFYHDCQDLHHCAVSLSGKLQDILLFLRRNTLKGCQTEEAQNETVEVEKLSYAADAMQSVAESFRNVTLHELTSDFKSTVSVTSDVDLSPLADHKTVNNSSVPSRKTRSPLGRFKTRWWQEVLRQDRVTVAYLTYQIVTEILTRCNNIAEQNHNHRTLENLFRLSSLYNELLTLGAQDDMGVATFCHNTCPILQHPLRKLSITKILQVLAQSRAENCCHSLVNVLLDIYKPTDTPISVIDMDCNGLTTPENSDNSSLEVYRALTQHMTPPFVTTVLPPIENVGTTGVEETTTLQTQHTYSSEFEYLLAEEEAHVSILLSVAARSAPHLLGSGGVKPSRTSGVPRVSKQVRFKVVEYYQQVLWGEVGTFSEHVLLWWGEGPHMGTLPPKSCQLFWDWLRSVISSGSGTSGSCYVFSGVFTPEEDDGIADKELKDSTTVDVQTLLDAFLNMSQRTASFIRVLPDLVVPAVHSLADGLCCHVATTLWDQLFRQTLVHGRKFVYSADSEGSVCGQFFADVLHQLVILSNACEPTVPINMLPKKAIEDLPLVEQIPVLHRLDHSVHTARLWAASTARHLINSWSVDAFFVITQTDISMCHAEVQMLKLTDHKDFSEVHSEHVKVCAKMRSKLTSEVRDNIHKLKLLPDECIQGMATVCRTISLANLHMCFPEPRYWRHSSSMPPKPASPYVQKYLDSVLRPVLIAVSSLPTPVQQSIGATVLRLLCEAWLDYIYMHRIKFSEWGALQLLVDFGSVPNWLEDCTWLESVVRNHLAHSEVLRRCEGVGRLLLRCPGEPVAMISPVSANKSSAEDKDSPRGSIQSEGLDTMPAEMFVPNQEQWLELRVPKHKGLCGGYSLCCSS